MLALISKISSFKNVDFENLDQGHTVQHAQWYNFMANINVYKSHNPHFLCQLSPFPRYKGTKCLTMKI